MRLIWLHWRYGLREVIRSPAFFVPTVLFPTLLFLFFGVANAKTAESATFVMASFSVYAVMGIAFYQFGIGIAEERGSPWETYVRALPISPMVRFVAMVLAALTVALVAVVVLLVAASQTTPAHLPPERWLGYALALAVGAVPFGLFGIALGYWVPPKAAVPIANLIYLPLAFAGGLWLPPASLPGPVARISVMLPSRMAGELAWAAAFGRPWSALDLIGIGGYTILFMVLALWGFRRNEVRNYG